MDAPVKDMSEAEKIQQMAVNIKKIADLSDEEISRLSKSLLEFDINKFRTIEERDKLSNKLGIPHFILNKSFVGLLAIFSNAARHKQDFEELLDNYLNEITTDEELQKIKRFSTEILFKSLSRRSSIFRVCSTINR